MSDETRLLLVLRHAKAEAFAPNDHDRVLTKRGVADAAAAGRWAAAAGLAPDHVVVSSAARAQGTWSSFVGASGCTPDVVDDQSLYAAGTDAALEILRCVPAQARVVMLVGHNPTMAYLVHLLDDGSADPAVFARLSEGFPTSALAVLQVSSPWAELDVAAARIIDFHVGRG